MNTPTGSPALLCLLGDEHLAGGGLSLPKRGSQGSDRLGASSAPTGTAETPYPEAIDARSRAPKPTTPPRVLKPGGGPATVVSRAARSAVRGVGGGEGTSPEHAQKDGDRGEDDDAGLMG
jgi:hypothetical protein